MISVNYRVGIHLSDLPFEVNADVRLYGTTMLFRRNLPFILKANMG